MITPYSTHNAYCKENGLYMSNVCVTEYRIFINIDVSAYNRFIIELQINIFLHNEKNIPKEPLRKNNIYHQLIRAYICSCQ